MSSTSLMSPASIRYGTWPERPRRPTIRVNSSLPCGCRGRARIRLHYGAVQGSAISIAHDWLSFGARASRSLRVGVEGSAVVLQPSRKWRPIADCYSATHFRSGVDDAPRGQPKAILFLKLATHCLTQRWLRSLLYNQCSSTTTG